MEAGRRRLGGVQHWKSAPPPGALLIARLFPLPCSAAPAATPPAGASRGWSTCSLTPRCRRRRRSRSTVRAAAGQGCAGSLIRVLAATLPAAVGAPACRERQGTCAPLCTISTCRSRSSTPRNARTNSRKRVLPSLAPQAPPCCSAASRWFPPTRQRRAWRPHGCSAPPSRRPALWQCPSCQVGKGSCLAV